MPTHLGEQLNDAQYEAVIHEGPPLIVLAGPGSGKTRVIVHRVAHLIEERDISPESIVALTFTNKAAEELRRRIGSVLGSSSRGERVVASTFHSFGLRLIRQFADLVGMRSEPTIIDEAQQRSLVRTILNETKIGLRRAPYNPDDLIEPALRFVSECRNNAIFPECALAFADEWDASIQSRDDFESGDERLAELTRLAIFRERATLYQRFEDACRERGWVTFDDLQTQALRLLREDERVRAIVRSDYRHVVVDEFQDVNAAQIELLREMAGPEHDLAVVGDDDQAIYGFRGSIPHSFQRVEEHWPNTKTIQLTVNYRSSRIIVAAADRIVQGVSDRFRPDKVLQAGGANADADIPIEGVTYAGTAGAGALIGERILEQVSAGNLHWKDAAVIVRTNKDLERIATTLEAMDIPVETPETRAALTHPVVADVTCWLRILADPTDESFLLRILIRPPFLIPLDELMTWLNEFHVMRRDAYRALRDLAEKSEAGENETPVDAGEMEALRMRCHRSVIDQFIEWQRHEAIPRFAEMYRALAEQALTSETDDLVLQIIHMTGALTIDPVDPLEHRARGEQLGLFLAFVRERLPMVEPPRRVQQFMRYYDDLEAGGGAIAPGLTPEDRMDAGIEFSERDAVRLLTAHKSKGLEFDTVFLPRINSHGYPPPNRENDADLIPAELRAASKPDSSDEERRVFFVALTRAQRRLVLLAQTRFDSGRKTSPSLYWRELIDDESNPFPVVRVSAESLDDESNDAQTGSEAGAVSDVLPGEDGAAGGLNTYSAIRRRERLVLRQQMYAVLHELSMPICEPGRVAALRSRLSDLGMRLAVMSARSAQQVDELLETVSASEREELQSFIQSVVTRDPWFDLLPEPTPPLELSFSDIELYLRCPRCYWLRHVVGLRERGSEAAGFGSIIHRTLEFFYRDWIRHRAHPDVISKPGIDDLIRLGRESYEELRSVDEPWSDEMDERIEASLRNFFEAFHDEQVNPFETETATVFDFPHGGHVHRIKARIDRIDRVGKNGFRVIDYKTGAARKRRTEPKPNDLQLGVYYLALQHRLEKSDIEGTAEYWLATVGERGVLAFDKIKIEKVCADVASAIDGILARNWQKDKNCTSCDFLSEAWDWTDAESEAGGEHPAE